MQRITRPACAEASPVYARLVSNVWNFTYIIILSRTEILRHPGLGANPDGYIFVTLNAGHFSVGQGRIKDSSCFSIVGSV
ncbi:MAG: hypothetical protein IPH45_17250 [Bacteroidales bacterium]|nr:hypothetical protein [Bacteroidales bacterium]